ncbi:hypothetical protein VNI00_006443 [Paramarasmius palmivorus]|uniref:Polysaccharide lyase 14 domain-containing protein n=1 Tax=Paramarasmius palmivorus TaxID=297713 RepID=A0AAW0D7S7_9AGAR
MQLKLSVFALFVSLASVNAAALSARQSSSVSISSLLPPSNLKSKWTTLPGQPNALPLDDSTLRPQKVLTALPHPYVTAPDGKTKAMKAHFPKGSYTFSHEPQGGLSFYAPGPSSVNLETAKEAWFGYSVFFDEGFGFQKGGKLPGLYGGDTADGSVSCSGGRKDTTCFSVRLMWRTGGAGELYVYLPPSSVDPKFAPNDKLCDIPNSHCNDAFGTSVARGAFTFKAGQWNTISQRVKLNDAGKANGELELFFEGKSVISGKGLMIRGDGKGKIRGIQMQTFFGGSDESWASPKDQDLYFAHFSAGISQTL